MRTKTAVLYCAVLVWAACWLAACGAETTTPAVTTASTPLTPTQTAPAVEGLTKDQAATLQSLTKLDEYPLYTMHYYGPYQEAAGRVEWELTTGDQESRTWACSLFAALADEDNRVFGRNFDWEFSPAVLLFTEPPDGYASVSMVDIAYLGYSGVSAMNLMDLPLAERQGLLRAPFLPFDGMNERGLAVGMAAVPPGNMEPDPARDEIGSLGVIRQMLDRAANVDEALTVLESFNIDFGGGPPLHYLLADRSGKALLVEFYQGEMVVIPTTELWHLATNFLRAAAPDAAGGQCQRYDRIADRLAETGGRLDLLQAADLLHDVSQNNTQWSIVYDLSAGEIGVVMGRQTERTYLLSANLGREGE